MQNGCEVIHGSAFVLPLNFFSLFLLCVYVFGVVWLLDAWHHLGSSWIYFKYVSLNRYSSSSGHCDAVNFLSHVPKESRLNHSSELRIIPMDCLERSKDHPVVVIKPKDIENYVMYLAEHALICKFKGFHVSLPFLMAWEQRN